MAGRGQLARQAPSRLVASSAPSFWSSARRLDADARDGEESLQAEPRLHGEAWDAYDTIPEVNTIVSSSAGLLSQCRLYPGFVDEQQEERRLRGEDGKVAAPFTEAFVADCETVLGRYVDSGGSQRGLLLAQSENYDVTGGGYLVGWPTGPDGKPWFGAEEAKAGERWEFVSRGALEKKAGTANGESSMLWTIRLAEDGKPVTLPASANTVRMWRKHPRRPGDSRGWVLAALDVCRDLRVFRMAQRSAGRSSIPAGILVTASEASPKDVLGGGGGQVPMSQQMAGVPQGWPGGFLPGGAPGSGVANQASWAMQLERLIGDAVMEVLRDAQSGRAVVPAILAVSNQYVESFNMLDLARPIDSALAGLVEQSRIALAQVADCPPEMLLGLGATNRWNGAQIADDEFRRYFRPKAMGIADDWTTDLFWAGLRALGYREELIRSVRVLVDARGVVAEPDKSQSATEGVKLGALSLAAWRSANGYNEETDAPSPEEQAMLLAAFGRTQVTGGSDDQVGEVNRNVGSAQAAGATLTVPSQLPPVKLHAAATDADSGLTGDALAAALVAVEQDCRTRLEEACEAALDQALTRAGSKLRALARKDHDLRSLLPVGLEAREVAARLGPERSLRLATAEFASEEQRREDLFAAVLITLLLSFGRISNAAYAKALRILHVAIVAPGEVAPAGWAAIPAAEVAANIDRGGVVLRESMLRLADREVFDPVSAPAVGELSSFRVPSSVVRRAMAAAGGGSVEPGIEPLADATDGLVFGPTLRAYEPAVLGWVWDYGAEPRMRPYEPHLFIDGNTYTGPEDPSLSGIAPGGGQGFPGDHFSCKCQWWPQLADPEPVE